MCRFKIRNFTQNTSGALLQTVSFTFVSVPGSCGMLPEGCVEPLENGRCWFHCHSDHAFDREAGKTQQGSLEMAKLGGRSAGEVIQCILKNSA